MNVFCVIFALSFFLLLMEKDKKLVLTQKQLIMTGKWHAEHLFAGRNTQHLSLFVCLFVYSTAFALFSLCFIVKSLGQRCSRKVMQVKYFYLKVSCVLE